VSSPRPYFTKKENNNNKIKAVIIFLWNIRKKNSGTANHPSSADFSQKLGINKTSVNDLCLAICHNNSKIVGGDRK